MKIRLWIMPLLLAALFSADLVAQAGSSNHGRSEVDGAGAPLSQWLRRERFSASDRDSQTMADHFSFFQALPLAWYELHDDAFCLRLFHHHNPGEFKPRVTAIAVEYRGWMSGSGVVSVSDELHLQRASKVCAESDAKDFAELFRTAGLFSLPSLATRPIMIAGSKFELEMRWGKEYRFIRFDAPAMLTKDRGMESLYAITTALMRIAEIPPSTVFYGDRR